MSVSRKAAAAIAGVSGLLLLHKIYTLGVSIAAMWTAGTPASVGLIGGSDGATAVFLAHGLLSRPGFWISAVCFLIEMFVLGLVLALAVKATRKSV